MGRGVGFTRETGIGIERFWREGFEDCESSSGSKCRVTDDSCPSKGAIYEGTSTVHPRAPFMRVHRMFIYDLSRESFRKSTPSNFGSSFGALSGNSHSKLHHKDIFVRKHSI